MTSPYTYIDAIDTVRVGGQEKYEKSRSKNIEGETTYKKDTYTKSVKRTNNKLVRKVEINARKKNTLKPRRKVNAC